ncbi:hypothetical protein NC651_017079 [Populus alba x Populus x berolinensis]|nr:hypothetical protein NC651_017079 [Populus alba x Populus x berolinensis]
MVVELDFSGVLSLVLYVLCKSPFSFSIAPLESEAAEVLEFGCWKFGVLISIAGIWELKIWD